MYPGAKTKIYLEKDNPMRILQIVSTEEEHFRTVIEDRGVFIEALWPEAETVSPSKPRLIQIQCYKCLEFGHIATLCPKKQSWCGRSKSHKHTDCAEPKELWKFRNIGQNHDSTGRENTVFLNK